MAQDKRLLGITLDGTGTEIPSLSVSIPYEGYLLSGTATAIGNYAIVPTGTPQKGTSFKFIYNATLDITTNGTTFSLFGTSVTQAQLLKLWKADCLYNGTSWEVRLDMSFTETGIVSTTNLADLSVTTPKINNLAVTSGKLAADSVITSKILDLNVTTAKINDLAVTDAKLAADSVTTAKILDNNVTNAKLAQMAANTVKMNNTGVLADPQDVTVATLVNGNAWSLTGNSGTVAGTNFLGTTDAVDLVFKVNNYFSGWLDLSLQNTSFGLLSLVNITSGQGNSGFGNSALGSITSGSFNTAMGTSSSSISTGSNNSSCGFSALSGLSSGSNNTGIGCSALTFISTGSNNTTLGYNADVDSTSSLNRIALGCNATADTDYQFALPDDVTAWKIRGNSFTLPSADGGVKAALVTNGSGTLSFGSIIDSGSYTPTLVNGTNVAASTAYPNQWMRIGSVVTVSGKVDIDITANAPFELGMSLPVASNFANDYECAGTCVSVVQTDDLYIKADTTNNRASFNGDDNDLTNHSHYFTFTYTII